MSQNYKKLTIIPEDVNILLIGERSAGKSTFAHAFANYMKYGEFSAAEENKVSYLPPSSLNGTNTTNVVHSSGFGRNRQQKDQQNIDIIPTENACSYTFPLLKSGKRIHVIDTPGFDDILKEVDNFESILTYVSQIENLHAVCFVLKPNSSMEISVLQYRLKFLLSRLEKSASKNIIFLFTHSSDSNYSPEFTETVLKGIVDRIKSSPSQIDIKYGKENVFCLDNEAFHFLISANNVAYSNTIRKTYSEIWDHSVAECWRMIEYILGKKGGCEEIPPHKVRNTVLLYNARKIISQASQFFVDIADIVEHLERDFILTDDILLNRNVQSPYIRQGRVYLRMQRVGNSCDIGKAEELIEKIESQKSDYENDKDEIARVLQNLVVSVKFTAMLLHNDSHEAYIKHLINQEIRQIAEADTDAQKVINYHGLLKQYTEEIRIIKQNVSASPITITTTHLLEGMRELKKLEKIKENFETLHREVIATRTK